MFRDRSSARFRLAAVLLVAGLLGAACGGRDGEGASPTPIGSPLSEPGLKLRVLGALGGHLEYCDPDVYPVAAGSPLQQAKRRMPEIRKDRTTFRAILEYEHLSPGHLTDRDLIKINDDYKQIQIIQLVAEGDGYRFAVVVGTDSPGGTETEASGTVDPSGNVTVEHQGLEGNLSCPICLAAGTRIATPSGPVPVQQVRSGMAVWTTDLSGRRFRGVVLETAQAPVVPGQQVVQVVLADGRTVLASYGHPTGDGRVVGELRRGDRLNGSRVLSAARIAYAGAKTYDVLPSGPTGTYFANGVLLGSTLRRESR